MLHLVEVNMWSLVMTSCHLSKEFGLPVTDWHHFEGSVGYKWVRVPHEGLLRFVFLGESP